MREIEYVYNIQTAYLMKIRKIYINFDRQNATHTERKRLYTFSFVCKTILYNINEFLYSASKTC